MEQNFSNHAPDKVLEPRIYEEQQQLSNQTLNLIIYRLMNRIRSSQKSKYNKSLEEFSYT